MDVHLAQSPQPCPVVAIRVDEGEGVTISEVEVSSQEWVVFSVSAPPFGAVENQPNDLQSSPSKFVLPSHGE